MQVTNNAPAAGGGGTPDNIDWVEVDLTDSSWTLNDPDSVLSSISNTSNLNSVTVSTTSTPDIVEAGVHWKELLKSDGSSYDISDSPVAIECYIVWPSTGWSVDSGATTGGLDRPARGSRVYTVCGVMGDPENLPATSGATEWPRDIIGCGISSDTSNHKHKMLGVKNTSTTSPRGSIDTFGSDFNTISASDYSTDGRKFMNRITWWTRINKSDWITSSGIRPASPPRATTLNWSKHYDDGDQGTVDKTYNLIQSMGRGNTDNKLYFFVSHGRLGGAGSSATVDFRCFYRIHNLDGGNHPSGRTGL